MLEDKFFQNLVDCAVSKKISRKMEIGVELLAYSSELETIYYEDYVENRLLSNGLSSSLQTFSDHLSKLSISLLRGDIALWKAIGEVIDEAEQIYYEFESELIKILRSFV